jgi:DMSO/TMAO reductase YedYZ molybdopterin-dependent catalytic subunit
VFDLRTLNAMATVTTSTYEPFVKKAMTFTGVPMADLFARAGIAPGATKVHLHALDDYKVDLRVADLADRRVLLATKADGAAIPVRKGGPIRLIFPADSSVGKNKDLWIWSVDSITLA